MVELAFQTCSPLWPFARRGHPCSREAWPRARLAAASPRPSRSTESFPCEENKLPGV